MVIQALHESSLHIDSTEKGFQGAVRAGLVLFTVVPLIQSFGSDTPQQLPRENTKQGPC